MTRTRDCAERGRSTEKLGQYPVAVDDPRCPGKVEHHLLGVLVIAAIDCAESWDDMALYGRSKLAWFRTVLDLPNGISSHETFRRVFMLIDPDAFEAGFTAWVGSLAIEIERGVVVIECRAIRYSHDNKGKQLPLKVVSSWAELVKVPLAMRVECQRQRTGRHWCWPALGGRQVSRTRSQPSPQATPRRENQRGGLKARAAGPVRVRKQHHNAGRSGVLDRPCREGLGRGGDYLPSFKGNHPRGHAAVMEHFDQRCFRVVAPHHANFAAFDDTHGRLKRSQVLASTEAAARDALSGAPGLHTVLAVESIRSVNSAPLKLASEIRYLLSSCPGDPAVLR